MDGHSRAGNFTSVGENLYRYSANKMYYGVFRRHGKLRWRSLKTKDRELANRRLKDELGKAKHVDPRRQKLTLTQLLPMFEEQLGRYDEGTRLNKRAILNVFKKTWPSGLDIPVSEVTTAQLEVWLAKQQQRMTRAGYNSYVIFIRQLFDLAVNARSIGKSPAKTFKMVKPESPIRNTPTWEQFQAIVTEIRSQTFNADSEDSGDLVEFMGLAGAGTAECANFRKEHINFQANRITLYRKKTDTGYSIPIFPQLMPLLTRLAAKSDGGEANGPLFKIKDLKKSLSGACRRLGFPHFSARALRRCFITRAIELGVDFKTIAAWQGHRDGGVLVAKTYSHLRSEHSDAMAKKLQVPCPA